MKKAGFAVSVSASDTKGIEEKWFVGKGVEEKWFVGNKR